MKNTVLSLTTFCCLFYSTGIFAQPTASWLIGSTNTVSSYSLIPGNGGMKSDSLGNSYLFGETALGTVQFGSISLDSSTGSASWLYIAKVDPLGNPLWIKGITCNGSISAHNIHVNQSGYFSIVGDYSVGTVTFDPTHSLTTKNYSTYFVAGYDPSGNLLWVNSPDSSGPVQIKDLFVSKYNATYCVGNFVNNIVLDSINYPSIEGTSVFISKINSTGKVEWLRQGTTSDNAIAYGQKITAYNGEVYLAGFFRDSITFNSTVIYGDNNQQIYLARYDSAGNFQWVKLIGGSPGGGYVTGLGVDGNYNINLSGSVNEDGAVFGGDTIPGVSDSNGAFVLGCDSTGAFKWVDAVYCPTGSTINDLATGKIDGSTFVAGVAADSFLLVGGTTQAFDTIGGTHAAYGFLLKFNSDGQLQWNKVFGGRGTVDAEEIGLQEYQLNVAGLFSDTLSVDAFTVNAPVFSTQVYLCSFAISPTTGIVELPQAAAWKVFPVPTSNKLIVETGSNSSAQLLVTDLSGRVLSNQVFNGIQTTLDLTALPMGVYIITMQNKDGSNSSKLIVKQ